jgi:HlyD family secretion protein
VLEVRAQVAAQTIVKLHDGLTATVQVLDQTLPATVTRVSPALDPTTLLGTVRIQVGATKAPVGSAATARIVIAQRPGLVVPASALRRSAIGSDEIVVCDNNVARVKTVTVGDRGDPTEIAKGLAPGDLVVVDHALGLEDGQPLVTQ